jgi:hypothetical protein
MRTFFVELGPTRGDTASLSGGSLLVTANNHEHAQGVADEWILEQGLRANLRVAQVRESVVEPHVAKVLFANFVIE